MRHAKHSNQLGRKKEHRTALMANMAMALIKNRRIRTTLAKAKALRPFIEKIITLAKKAHATDDKLKKQHYHTLALSRVRDLHSVNRLFSDLVEEFINRPGGYTRIYKLVPRLGDAADMAIIEMVPADDEGYGKRKPKAKKSAPAAEEPKAEESAQAEEATEVAEAEEATEAAEAEASSEDAAEPEAPAPEADSAEAGEAVADTDGDDDAPAADEAAPEEDGASEK